jgi:hypothetical protein
MYKDLGISEEDWGATPQSVKSALIALQHQARLLEIRFSAYEKKLAALEAKEAEIESLKTEVAAFARTSRAELLELLASALLRPAARRSSLAPGAER